MSEMLLCRQPEPDEQDQEVTDVRYKYTYNITAIAEQSDITDWVNDIVFVNLCHAVESDSSCFLNVRLLPNEDKPRCTVQNARHFGCWVGPQMLRVFHSRTCSTQNVQSDVAEILANSTGVIIETFREDKSDIFQSSHDDDSSLVAAQLNNIQFQLLEESSIESSARQKLNVGGMIAVILSGCILLCATLLMLIGFRNLLRGCSQNRKEQTPRSSDHSGKRSDKWQSYVAKKSSRSLRSKVVVSRGLNDMAAPKSRSLRSWFDPVVTETGSGPHKCFIDAIECGVREFESDIESLSDCDRPIKTSIRRIAIVPVETMITQTGASDTRSSSGESSVAEDDVLSPFEGQNETVVFESVEASLDSTNTEAVQIDFQTARRRSSASICFVSERSGQLSPDLEQRNTLAASGDDQETSEHGLCKETTPIETLKNSFGEVEIEAICLTSLGPSSEQGNRFEAVEAKLKENFGSIGTRSQSHDQNLTDASDPLFASNAVSNPIESARPFAALRQASVLCSAPSASCGLLDCNVNMMKEALMIEAPKTPSDQIHTNEQLRKEPGLAIVSVLDDIENDQEFSNRDIQECRSKSEPTVPNRDFQETRSISAPTANGRMKKFSNHDPAHQHVTGGGSEQKNKADGGSVPNMVEADTWSSDSTEGVDYDPKNSVLASDLLDDASDDDIGISSHFEEFSASICREDTVFSGSCTESSIFHDERSQEFKRIWSESDGSTLFALSEETDGEAISVEEQDVRSDSSPGEGENESQHNCESQDAEENEKRSASHELEKAGAINYVRTTKPESNFSYQSRKARSIQL